MANTRGWFRSLKNRNALLIKVELVVAARTLMVDCAPFGWGLGIRTTEFSVFVAAGPFQIELSSYAKWLSWFLRGGDAADAVAARAK